MKIEIATLFPDMCERVLQESIIGRARRAGKLDISCVQIRDYAGNKHNRVDDTPYGGGMGMVMQAQPLFDCCQAVYARAGCKVHTVYLSPQGPAFTQQKAVQLAQLPHLLLVCGHYEGVDQRFIDEVVDEELSIGDYVLTGGELAALVVADAIGRLCEGVLPDESCYTEESHFSGLLEYPQYTKPALWRGRPVPEVLLSGHHENIRQWRQVQALETTRRKRPDLYEAYLQAHPPQPEKKKRRRRAHPLPGADAGGRQEGEAAVDGDVD